MRVVHGNKISKMTDKAVTKIALTLLDNSRGWVFINTKENPYSYLDMLKGYGINASAKPKLRNNRVVGYRFKNAS